jgi:hypothetical protein
MNALLLACLGFLYYDHAILMILCKCENGCFGGVKRKMGGVIINLAMVDGIIAKR